MSSPNMKAAGLIFKLLATFIASLLLAGWGFYKVLALALFATIVFIAEMSGKLPTAFRPLRKPLVYLTVIALFACFLGFVMEKQVAQQAVVEKSSEERFNLAKDLLRQKKYDLAIINFGQVAQQKTSHSAEAQALLEFTKNFTSEEALKNTFLNLSRDDFAKLSAGKDVSLVSNQENNKLLSDYLRAKLPKFKPVYLSVKNEEDKVKKEDAKREKRYKNRVAKFGEPPTKSAWNGSYLVVEQFLKDRANDPSSIEIAGCTDLSSDDSAGWLVGFDFRGKNAFGGLVKNSNWFIIKHGQVVKALPADSYRTGH